MASVRLWRAPMALIPALVLALIMVAAVSATMVRGAGAGPESGLESGEETGCLSCHQGIEPAGAGHAMACAVCHLSSARQSDPSPDHGLVMANPSHPLHARTQCGPCHSEQVRAVEASVHATLAGIINQTRYLWGAQTAAEPPVFSANSRLRPLPDPSPRPRSPAMLVDAFLRSQCLACHIGTRGAGGPGLYRGEGCAACHADYASDGLYTGGDRAVERDMPGRPVRHGLTASMDDARCLRCHHGNHVGGDLHGLFDRDTAPMFQQALSWGRPMPRPYGASQHVLARDVHAERGMTCLDCHGGAQVMGLDSGEGPSCSGCHGGRDGACPNSAVPGVEAVEGGFAFRRRDGRLVPLPVIASGTPGHARDPHGRVACFACHAQWTYGDYGLSVLRRDDAVVGTWCMDFRFRRWEGLALGVDRMDRIVPLRPRHQYLVSYVDRLGRTIMDSVVPVRGDGAGPGWAFAPYAPHTTGAAGRSCQECHGNPEAAGLAPGWALPPDMDLLRASRPVAGRGRLLDASERRRLLEPDEPYRKAFAEYLLELLGDR